MLKRKTRKHTDPFITSGGRYGYIASCGCGWEMTKATDSAQGATYLWSKHVEGSGEELQQQLTQYKQQQKRKSQ